MKREKKVEDVIEQEHEQGIEQEHEQEVQKTEIEIYMKKFNKLKKNMSDFLLNLIITKKEFKEKKMN